MKKILIGRDSSCDYVIDNEVVSRSHGEIYLTDNWEVNSYYDHSTNGTKINGNYVHQSGYPLKENDILSFPDGSSVCVSEIVARFRPANARVAPQPVVNQNYASSNVNGFPQLRTNRSLVKYFFLSLVTFGIYGIIVLSHISEDINLVARKDNKSTMHYCLIFFLLGPLTLEIMTLIWNHKLCSRINNQLLTRGIQYEFGASDFWLWKVLGSLIVVGRFIFIHKLMKAMNLINADYNAKGE